MSRDPDGRRDMRRRAVSLLVLALTVAVLPGCIMEGEQEVFRLLNETDTEVEFIRAGDQRQVVQAGDMWVEGINGQDLRDCREWDLRVEVDGVEVARFGPPVCGGEWVITEEMLRSAGLAEVK